jgi:hypothetical protein
MKAIVINITIVDSYFCLLEAGGGGNYQIRKLPG